MARVTRYLPAVWLSLLPAPQAQLADLPRAADAYLSARVAADSFSGTVLVARQGKVLYERAAGFADREHGAAIQMDTRIQIASTTKLFTQIAIRQLEQAGKLSLSDTVGRFLPDYPNPTVRSRVTVEQLLRHRSGVGSFWNEKWRTEAQSVRSVRDYMELFQRDSLLFEPGTGEAYSNGGYVILGAIIERLSGQSYQDYLREKVFRAAGMSETVPYDSRVTRSNAAIGYTSQPLDVPVTGDRRLAGPGPRPGYERRDSTPAGNAQPGLRIIGPDGRQLSPEAAREAMARRAGNAGPRRPNTAMQPGMSGPAGDHYSTVGDFLKLATALLGHRLLDSARTAAVLGSRFAAGQDFRANGGGPGTNAEFSIYPGGDVIVVLSNYDPPAGTAVAQFLRSVLAPPAAVAPH
jgi:CubicO group peptidase (beta-lactamase class C family)